MMHTSNPLKLVLVTSGLIAAGIGGAILIMPEAFYSTYGIELGDQVSLFNEVRAMGGGLLTLGIVIVAGAFVAELTFTSAVIASALYLSYGLSRLLSVATDGLPGGGLVGAAAFELTLGTLTLLALRHARKTSSPH